MSTNLIIYNFMYRLSFLFNLIPILIGILLPISTYAGSTSSVDSNEHKWRMIFGEQFTHRSFEGNYKEKVKSSPREVKVSKNFSDSNYLGFPLCSLEYKGTHLSFWELTYNTDNIETSALTKEKIKLLFIPIVLTIRVPVKISTQTLKIGYNRTLFQIGDFELGGSLGLEAFNVDAEAKIPFWHKESKNITVPVPFFGVFASYKLSDSITFRLKTNYFSLRSFTLGSVTVSGTKTEIDCSLEYQLISALMLGAGYRYSSLKVELDHENYRANGTYTTYGPTLFVGVSF